MGRQVGGDSRVRGRGLSPWAEFEVLPRAIRGAPKMQIAYGAAYQVARRDESDARWDATAWRKVDVAHS